MALQAGSRRASSVDALTAREREVPGLMTGGVTSDRDLGEWLCVTQNTVKYHISNLLSKLGQRNRAQLIAYALRHRLVNASPAQPDGGPSGEISRGTITAVHTRAASTTRPRILVADDDEPMLELMTSLLGDEGEYEVLTHALDGEIHDHVAQVRPDLVILDLLDGSRQEAGWRALELLRLDPVTSHIPVILCSAAADKLEGHKEWSNKLNANVLAKPFDIYDMLGMVRDALGTRQ